NTSRSAIRRRYPPWGCVSTRGRMNAQNWSQIGSMIHDGTAGISAPGEDEALTPRHLPGLMPALLHRHANHQQQITDQLARSRSCVANTTPFNHFSVIMILWHERRPRSILTKGFCRRSKSQPPARANANTRYLKKHFGTT